MPPSKESDDIHQAGLSRADAVTGAAVLIGAQLAAASTASCVKALPDETPSVLRGLWRQTLTSAIFSAFALLMWLREGRRASNRRASMRGSMESEENSVPDEVTGLLVKPNDGTAGRSGGEAKAGDGLSPEHLVLVALTVFGATLLNDTIVVALRYASSAAVMCLCNTTPIWLILYAIINCRSETPGMVTIMGASLSLVGTVVCSTGEADDGTNHDNERLGAIIATTGAIGSAVYMTACRKLAPVGLHPIHLSLIINIGMMTTTFLLCITTLPEGIEFFSTDITVGFFGFLNPDANPAAVLHSIFPDLGGNFGIMLALRYFEPLIVSLVMLTEPLNASIIAMYAVHEEPPSQRTMFGVFVVLVGCAIVLWESNKDAKETEAEEEEAMGAIGEEEEEGYGAAVQIAHRRSVVNRRRRSSLVLYSQLGKVAPEMAARVARLELEESRRSKRHTIAIINASEIRKIERGTMMMKHDSSRV